MSKIAICKRVAARSLLNSGHTFGEVKKWWETVHMPSEGYVYAEDIKIGE